MTERKRVTPNNLARKIIASKRICNMVHPDEPGKRVVGWVVDADLVGLYDGVAAVDHIAEKFIQRR